MADKFKGKYRIQSTRLQKWDYSWAAPYFITICTKNRDHYFGEIEGGKMKLSTIGVIADILWYEIKNHATNVELGEFVVMPNHIHAILVLNEKSIQDNGDSIKTPQKTQDNRETTHSSETTHALSLKQNTPQPELTPGQKRFQHQERNSVSSIIGSYKSAVSKHAHRLGFTFEWQANFDERIVRDDASYQRIMNYIRENPSKWKEDRFSN